MNGHIRKIFIFAIIYNYKGVDRRYSLARGHNTVKKILYKKIMIFFTFLILILQIFTGATGEQIPVSSTTEIDTITPFHVTVENIIKNITETNTYSNIELYDCSYIRIPGNPTIPYKTLTILIPPNSIISKIDVSSEKKEIFLIRPIAPTDLTTTFSFSEQNKKTYTNNILYESTRNYPETLYEIISIQSFRGYKIALLNIYPILYHPKSNMITYHSYYDISIHFQKNKENQESVTVTDYDNEIDGMVINPSYKSLYTNYTSESNDTYEYVIITPEIFKSNFHKLIDHKSQYISAKIMTLEDITSNKDHWVNGTYGDATNNLFGNPFIEPGQEVLKNFSLFNDTTAKIRNFIRYAHLNWETNYILLAGDNEFIPARRLYAYVDNWAASDTEISINAQIISDHYFSALDGTWNADFDINFGETSEESVQDEADFYSEIYVGRAPINDKSDANIFINKVIAFETSIKPFDVQIHQSYTNPRHEPDTTMVSEACIRQIPDSFNIHRLYEANEKVTNEKWVDAFRNPEKLLIFQVGNGYNDGINSWYQLSWDNRVRIKFDVLDCGHLNNSFYPIHISLSCLTGDFSENESLAEEMLLVERGGPSACFANSEVGCITKNDARAYSGEYYEALFKSLFEDASKSLGESLEQAKQGFISQSCSIRQYRWCFYIMNLLGDPESGFRTVRNKADSNYDTYYVDDDYNPTIIDWNLKNFSSIQSAIDAIEEYGTILIHEGTYKEHITIDKTLTIKGLEQEKTIICNTNEGQGPVIGIHCNSTSLSNLTITSDTFQEPIDSLITIYPNCNGNRITDCIILENRGKGIQIIDSIRNIIRDNIIEKNDCGIYLYNLIESSVILTCDNHIERNIIRDNRECGIYIGGSMHNFIIENDFISNGKSRDTQNMYTQNDLCLILTRDNVINGNYWNAAQTEPYRIYSYKGPIFVFKPDLSRGWAFKLWTCIYIFKDIGIPLYPVYDMDPSQQPICS